MVRMTAVIFRFVVVGVVAVSFAFSGNNIIIIFSNNIIVVRVFFYDIDIIV